MIGNKIVCIYHSIDLDGWMSAAIVKHWFTTNITNKMTENNIWDSIEFIGYNYGQPIPDLSEYDKVIMVDISFPAKEMINIAESKLKGNFIYIDHHISSMNDIKMVSKHGNIPFVGIQDTNYAACELTWQYFFPNEPMPEIVRLLGRYDCFGHKGTDEEQKVLEFQYGARQCVNNYEEAYKYLEDNLSNIPDYALNTNTNIELKGKSIYSYLCTEAKQVYKNGFEVAFYSEPDPLLGDRMFKFIAINRERFNPINFGIDYHADGYDGCASFHYAGGQWNFSLYNANGEVDCSVIAKTFGGGGHKGTAGFGINDINQIIE